MERTTSLQVAIGQGNRSPRNKFWRNSVRPVPTLFIRIANDYFNNFRNWHWLLGGVKQSFKDGYNLSQDTFLLSLQVACFAHGILVNAYAVSTAG
jgi:hypothetical protein